MGFLWGRVLGVIRNTLFMRASSGRVLWAFIVKAPLFVGSTVKRTSILWACELQASRYVRPVPYINGGLVGLEPNQVTGLWTGL